jgi:enoyl-CoA hydratase/carnithine racemase
LQTLTYDIADNVATITLNRPERLNAFNTAMMLDLQAAFDRSDADDAVRCVILTGTGRAFCSGADVSGGADTFGSLRDDPAREALRHGDVYRDGGGVASLRIYRSLKPVIAAVNGPAVGIGATMLLSADIRLAADSAWFGFIFVRRGIVPEAASSWFLPRLVGISRALEWSLTGRRVTAGEALAANLVQAVHGPNDLLPAARALAAEIAQNAAPVSAVLTRQMMWRMLGASHPMDAHRIDSRAIMSRGASSDAREGVASFLEKRAAHFSDKVSVDLPDLWEGWVEPDFR